MEDKEKLEMQKKLILLEMEFIKSQSMTLQLQYEKKSMELMMIEGQLKQEEGEKDIINDES